MVWTLNHRKSHWERDIELKCCYLQRAVSGPDDSNLFVWDIFYNHLLVFTLWISVTGEHLDHQLNLTTPMAPSWEATNSLTSTTMIRKTWQGKFSFDPQVLPVVWGLFLLLLNPSQGLTWRGRTTPRSVCRPGISWRGAQDTPHLWKYLWGSPVF